MGICTYTARREELIVKVHFVDKDDLTKTNTYMVHEDTTVVNLKKKIEDSLGFFPYE